MSFCRRDRVLSLNVPTVWDTRLEEALRNFDPSRLSDIAGETGRTTYADLNRHGARMDFRSTSLLLLPLALLLARSLVKIQAEG